MPTLAVYNQKAERKQKREEEKRLKKQQQEQLEREEKDRVRSTYTQNLFELVEKASKYPEKVEVKFENGTVRFYELDENGEREQWSFTFFETKLSENFEVWLLENKFEEVNDLFTRAEFEKAEQVRVSAAKTVATRKYNDFLNTLSEEERELLHLYKK